jgi:hypothetical protein
MYRFEAEMTKLAQEDTTVEATDPDAKDEVALDEEEQKE